jgi:hypothetical protein
MTNLFVGKASGFLRVKEQIGIAEADCVALLALRRVGADNFCPLDLPLPGDRFLRELHRGPISGPEVS